MTNGVYLHRVCGETADSAAEAFYHLSVCPLVRPAPLSVQNAIDLDEDSRQRLVTRRWRVEPETLDTTIRRA